MPVPRITEAQHHDLLNDLEDARRAIHALSAIVGSDAKRTQARADLLDVAHKLITVASVTSFKVCYDCGAPASPRADYTCDDCMAGAY